MISMIGINLPHSGSSNALSSANDARHVISHSSSERSPTILRPEATNPSSPTLNKDSRLIYDNSQTLSNSNPVRHNSQSSGTTDSKKEQHHHVEFASKLPWKRKAVQSQFANNKEIDISEDRSYENQKQSHVYKNYVHNLDCPNMIHEEQKVDSPPQMTSN